MANNFYINLDATKLFERFDMSKFMEFTDNFDPITSDFMQSVSRLKIGGTYTIKGEDARPDIISYELYGNTQYWWVIMFYNGITRVDHLTNGLEINFPDSDDLEDLYFTLKSKELGK